MNWKSKNALTVSLRCTLLPALVGLFASCEIGARLIAEQPVANPINAEKSPNSQAIFDEAHKARHVWKLFPGFEADMTVASDESVSHGSIVVDETCKYTLTLPGDGLHDWLRAKLHSVIEHRRPDRSTEDADRPDPKNEVIPFDGLPRQHVFGHEVIKSDGSGIFRIDQGRIREVHRKSQKSWTEITNLAYHIASDGTYLPAFTTVTYRDPSTGDIEKVNANTFEWKQVGGFELPAECVTVVTGKGGERHVQKISFTNHRLNRKPSLPSPLTDDVAIVPAGPGLLKPLPEALTSFGAATHKGYLYVFSGHNGDAHGFAKDLLNNHFRRIRYDDPKAEWEELAMHWPAQSVALLSDGKDIYRIAGLSFLNSAGEKTQFKSTSHFARYSPEENQWIDLPDLPEGRSSMDAAIIGRSIYVVGGWNLQGESARSGTWHSEMLRFDLDRPEQGWHRLTGPGYDTRALSVASHRGKLYAIGGITNSGMVRKVSVYDPVAQSWSGGPDLKPDSPTAGFATSAFETGGNLYVVGSSGVIYRLSETGDDWQVADRLLFPRNFLRLLPAGDRHLLAVGGTGAMGRTGIVEKIAVDPRYKPTAKSIAWSVPYSGTAKHSQCLVLDGGKLYAFGGNRSWAPHDFSKDAFSDEAFEFDIGRQTIKALPSIPRGLQSGVAMVNSPNSESTSITVFGGLGFNDKFGSIQDIFHFDPLEGRWEQSKTLLPEPRGMFDAARFDEAVWMFGGSASGKYINSVNHWWGDDSAPAAIPNIVCPTPRRSFGGAVVGNEYFAIGGLGEGNKIVEALDIFNFETKQWRQGTPPSVHRVFSNVCTDGKKIYLFGGFTNGSFHFEAATSLEAYEPSTDRWETISPSVPMVDAHMRMLSFQGRLIFFGIDRETSDRAKFVLFDPNPLASPESVEGISFTSPVRRSKDDAERDAKLLLRRDTDKDWRLSKSELGERMSQFFADADVNSDSYLVLDEIKAALVAQERDKEQGNE